jgi:uncharacterized protein (TIGR02246 family)
VSGLSATDREEIVEVVRRADERATARDVEGYLALTTTDMTLDGHEGTASGRANVRRAITAIWAAEPAGTRHLTSEVRVDATTESTAQARSTLSLVSGDEQQPTPGPVVSISQLLRKVDGRWLIARRTVEGAAPTLPLRG